jgi:hypothetical protein
MMRAWKISGSCPGGTNKSCGPQCSGGLHFCPEPFHFVGAPPLGHAVHLIVPQQRSRRTLALRRICELRCFALQSCHGPAMPTFTPFGERPETTLMRGGCCSPGVVRSYIEQRGKFHLKKRRRHPVQPFTPSAPAEWNLLATLGFVCAAAGDALRRRRKQPDTNPGGCHNVRFHPSSKRARPSRRFDPYMHPGPWAPGQTACLPVPPNSAPPSSQLPHSRKTAIQAAEDSSDYCQFEGRTQQYGKP